MSAPPPPSSTRLLSALAQAPLRQDLAVTGSVNQLGVVQAIGGVNEKIEGFFDICAARGLTGKQGVLIPGANVQHLMLREDVVRACADGVSPSGAATRGCTCGAAQPSCNWAISLRPKTRSVRRCHG